MESRFLKWLALGARAMLLLALAKTVWAGEPDAPPSRYSMPRAELAEAPEAGSRYSLRGGSLAQKAVAKDVSWGQRFAVRAEVASKELATITCGTDIFRDGFEN